MIWLIHPDKTVRQALAATLKHIDNNLEINEFDQNPGSVPADVIVLEAGTPIRLRALFARLDRLGNQENGPALLEFDGARLETRSRAWQAQTGSVTLTEKEVAVLVYLARRDQPASREDLLRDVWRYAPDTDTHTIETHIYRLRQKIEADPAEPRYLLTTKDGYCLAKK